MNRKNIAKNNLIIKSTNDNSNEEKIWDYIKKKRFEDALKLLPLIPVCDKWFFAKGKCLAGLHKHLDAITFFNEIKQKDKHAYLNLAGCYQKLGQHEIALNIILNAIPMWWEDYDASLNAAYCFQKLNQLKSALTIFMNIPSWWKDNKASLGVALCFEELGQYDDALNAYKAIKNSNNHKILLALARLYEKIGDHTSAWNKYQKAAEKYPSSTRIFYSFCYYAVNQNHPDAPTMLNKAIKKWSYHSGFYLLMAKHLNQEKKYADVKMIIEDVIKNYPYHFNRHVNKEELLKVWTTVESNILTHLSKKVKIKLPDLIKNVFASLPKTEKKYLVGSTVQTLVDHQPLSSKQDIDVVIFLQDPNQLCAFGFTSNHDVPNLFTKKIKDEQTGEDFYVDCYVVSPNQSIEQDALLRDFTIGCVYLGEDGVISDPTGKGLQDIYTKTLRTVIPAKESFANDPVRILRAIKKIVEGYHAIHEIIEAIEGWDPQDGTHLSRFNAVMKKHLASLDADKHQYDGHLNEYKITVKLNLLTQIAKPATQSSPNKDKKHPDQLMFPYYSGLVTGITLYAYVKERIIHPESYKERLSLRLKLPHHIEALDLAVQNENTNTTLKNKLKLGQLRNGGLTQSSARLFTLPKHPYNNDVKNITKKPGLK